MTEQADESTLNEFVRVACSEGRSPEVWECRHKPRCADAACSHNPAIQQWIKGAR